MKLQRHWLKLRSSFTICTWGLTMAQWRPRVHPELAGVETWAPADASASTARNIRNDPGIGASWSDRYLPSPAHFAPKSGLFATKDVQSADILGFRHRAS